MEELKPCVGDNICYIKKYCEPEVFKLKTTPITGIRIGKKATNCYSKLFSPLSIEEIMFNTNWMLENRNSILIQEPFLDTGDLKERAEKWCNDKGWLGKEV